ncbi:helix-turn-helix domain-containing protein [Spirillospora sp. CA-294931]|uniref:helix-turn-helix domain-containing protein n=1 Tax=Spirillospora sp. CA-294931 TaxID=3240042 RepID=UPI003D9043BB
MHQPATPLDTSTGSTQEALSLLETIGTHAWGATAHQLAADTGMPLGRTRDLLHTLALTGYVTPGPARTWRLGDRLEFLARRQAHQTRLAGA